MPGKGAVDGVLPARWSIYDDRGYKEVVPPEPGLGYDGRFLLGWVKIFSPEDLPTCRLYKAYLRHAGPFVITGVTGKWFLWNRGSTR